jgi:hypothetical protein
MLGFGMVVPVAVAAGEIGMGGYDTRLTIRVRVVVKLDPRATEVHGDRCRDDRFVGCAKDA